MFTKKKACRVCSAIGLECILDLGTQPPANAFLHKEDFVKEKRYPLRLMRCTNPDCGFVQLGDVVDAETLFSEYVYVSSTSPLFVKHFEEYAQDMARRIALTDGLTLDIGSNDGVLVKPLKALGARALGVDPATAIATRASEAGLETIAGYFTESFAKELKAARGTARLITANNVFAHIDDLDDVACGVRALLAPDGLFVIEVPYLVNFLEQRLFDTIYHEHLSYIAIRPLDAFFRRFGLQIIDVERVGVHGGSVRIMVAHQNAPFARAPIVDTLIREEEAKGLYTPEVYRQFAKEVLENKRALGALLERITKEGKTIAGYGAPAKGNTLLNFMNIGPEVLPYVVDDSPLKQGLYTPGMHIPVVASTKLLETPPDYLFILAWNFAPSIIKKNEDFAKQGGKFIVPVPLPHIV